MRVLHVTEALGGGVQSAIAHFIDSTPEFSHFVYGRARDGEQTVLASEAPVWNAPASLASFALGIRRAIRRANADAVHFHSSIAGAFRPVARGPVRVVYSPHCYAFERQDIPSSKRLAYRSAERMMAPFTDYVVAVSPHEASLARGVGARNVATVSNFVAQDTFEAQHSLESRAVVTVGRISEQKDPLLFAEVARRDTSGTNFIWIGDGDPGMRAALLDAGVEVTGWLGKDRIRTTLQASGLYLHTAAWEASPMSLAEALEWGVPVLSRDNSSLRSLGYECVGSTADEIGEAVRAFFDDQSYRTNVVLAAGATALRLASTPTNQHLREAYGAMEEQA